MRRSAASRTLEVGFYSPAAIETMDVHESIRRRIRDYQSDGTVPVID